LPGITWQEQQQEQRREQQRQRREQQRQQQEQQRQQQEQQRQQQEQLPSEQQQVLQQQALQQEQRLLLFGRKRSWKQPAEQPGERNISFDFPLRTNIKTHTRDRSGTCDPADARNSNKSAKENHYLLNFFCLAKIELQFSNKSGWIPGPVHTKTAGVTSRLQELPH
jgi:hypothetical protein